MAYLVFALLIVISIVIILMPFLKGNLSVEYPEILAGDNIRGNTEEIASDKIESIKLALRDLDMEHKIGKIAPSDFEVLKSELLDEWQEAQAEHDKITGAEKG